MWDRVIRAKRISNLLPVLEGVLAGFGKHPSHKRLTAPVQAKPVAEDTSSTPPVLHPLTWKR